MIYVSEDALKPCAGPISPFGGNPRIPPRQAFSPTQSGKVVALRHELVTSNALNASTSEDTWPTQEAAVQWADTPLGAKFLANRTDAFIIAVDD